MLATPREANLPDYLGPLIEPATRWHEGKIFIEHLVAICHDTLHLIAGTAIWLIVAIILKRPLTSWIPLIVVMMAALANEVIDLGVELWPSPGRQLGEGARDLMTTIAIPAMLFCAMRFRPGLFRANVRG